MSEPLPPCDENDPLEVLHSLWVELQQSMAVSGWWKAWLIAGIAATVGLCWILRSSLYPMRPAVIVKVAAYGVVPLILAWAGDHLASETVEDPVQRKLYRTLFICVAILGMLSVAVVENSADRDHTEEVGGLNRKLDAVHVDNQSIIGKLATPEPDPLTKEANRRQSLLTTLRNEYILSHQDVSAALLAGTEQPPTAWVNGRLKQLGQSWTVEGTPTHPRTSSTVTQVQTPYGNLAERCEELGNEIIEGAERRKAMQPDPRAHLEDWKSWYMQNDRYFFHAQFYKYVAEIRQQLAAVNFDDPQLDELIKEHEHDFAARQDDVQGAINFPQGYHLSIDQIEEIGQRLKYLASEIRRK